MAVLTIQEAQDGIQSVTMGSAADGDQIASGAEMGGWDLPVILLVRNTDAAAKTVTVDGIAAVVPATTGIAAIPVRSGPIGALKTITYSALTGVTVAALRFYSAVPGS